MCGVVRYKTVVVVRTTMIRKGYAQPKDLNSKLLKTTHWPNIGL